MTAKDLKISKGEQPINLIDFSEEFARHKIEELTKEGTPYTINIGNQRKRISTEEKDYTINQFLKI